MPRQYYGRVEPAERVRDLRRRLSLTQSQFAARLGLSRRTIIRAEQRGLWIPWSGSELTQRWLQLLQHKSHVPRTIVRKTSRKRKRLRRSHELLRAYRSRKPPRRKR